MRSLSKNEDNIIECTLLSGEVIKAKKVLLCTGAYARIHSDFINIKSELDVKRTQVVAGTFLERSIDLNLDSFYLTLDGHNLIYRKHDNKLILGSSSTKGPFMVGNHDELNKILDLYNQKLNLDLGKLNDFKIITGLRSKAPKRRPISSALDSDKSVFMINGLYKNGYSFPHLAAQKILDLIF